MNSVRLLMQISGPLIWIVIGACLVSFVAAVALAFRDLSLWVASVLSHADVDLLTIITMRFRKVNTRAVVLSRVELIKAGIREVSINDLESHDLSGGNVRNVARAVVAARHADLPLDWKKACSMDLAGDDVLGWVNAGWKLERPRTPIGHSSEPPFKHRSAMSVDTLGVGDQDGAGI